jgi:type III secretion protein R
MPSMTIDPFYVVVGLLILSLAPFAALMVTSYVKLSIVLSLVRNALGIQQIPPNMVINGLALILSIYIMAPVGMEMFDIISDSFQANKDFETIVRGAGKAREPLRQFLLKHSEKKERLFFAQSAKKLWNNETAKKMKDNDLMVLVPSFTVHELTSAFKTGFLIYLPFIIIDLIVSNILLAMGMMMLSPMTISLPFKLLLFVLTDGWTKLIHALVLSYA